ncbi:Hypothetical Protein FCC1311_101252 [Hondaea fermentalgiana]|uniref:Uncharacterized protein n=1 Tax=Hondaea fermentalgiana TaxID=2315210 RepID=A0A2R5GSR3_9STRA|nr:Hypothetical Protein FCC1311_101252 [Hondaea fermentalgiana]|eukprot:GBG33902.1 Hypothetical Protein FCC1311_101252 [Hondaea fermentalgiana]
MMRMAARSTARQAAAAARVAGRRALSTTEVKTAQPVHTPPVVRRGPSMSTRFTWFLFGVAGSLGLGYYQLSQDIDACTKSVEQSLAELRRDTLDSQKSLRKRLNELER